MDTHELREAFLRFFEERGHRRMPGAPIVPPGDPTLLFTSAGMVQFKPYFMGQSEPPNRRLTTVQKCFRTTDIESVGDTKHLTFFEMLGNFSIGDYFKAEIIPWAWEFYTRVLKLTPERLWAAVYLDDDEAYDIWVKIGVPKERIKRYGEEHNYWFSGEIGPCGPDSEIYYDFGEQFGCGPACEPSHECRRFLEIWNLVFMSFYCDGDKRTPLPSKNVDTGAGLERNACALLFESEGWEKSRLPSVYDTDLFAPIIKRIEELSGKKYGADERTDRAIRIVAEHARAVTLLIGDDRTPVLPSNEERGYVVRRMLRRAVYFGMLLGRGIVETKVWQEGGKFHVLDRHARRVRISDLALVVIDGMRAIYPELTNRKDQVLKVISAEEENFNRTLASGEQLAREMLVFRRGAADIGEGAKDPKREFRTYLEHLPRSKIVDEVTVPIVQSSIDGGHVPEKALTGREVFVLHDTYGFPVELTREIAAEHGFTVDEEGFAAEMERQRERARAAAGAADAVAAEARYASLGVEATMFRGYEGLEVVAKIGALVSARSFDTSGRAEGDGGRPRRSDISGSTRKNDGAGEAISEATDGSMVEVLLAATPFYPEGGGQVGDRGEIVGPNGRVLVEDTQRVAERLIVHRGRVVEGRVAVGDEVTVRVDARHRADTMRNHTATHLLHAALRKVLGTHVKQAGSLVAPDHLRFDFTHTEAVTREQLTEVERLVNEKVRQNLPVHTRLTSFDEAMSEGALAFFGEKYGEEVRVVEVNTVVPRFSAELCGGTHCGRTGDVGLVIITGESSIGAGMRRIEALSGWGAEEHVRERLEEIEEALRRLGGARGALLARLDALVAERDALAKRVERLERSLASAPATDQVMDGAVDVEGMRVLASQVDLPSTDALRYRLDAVRKTMGSGVAVLGSVIDGRLQFVAIASADAISKGVRADEILKRVAAVAGGSAGGRPEMAQGGGKDVSKIQAALAIVPEAVREMLSANGSSAKG